MIFEHLLARIAHIDRKLDYIMALLDALNTAVANETTVDQSVITLLNGLSQQLKDAIAAADPAAIQAVVDQIDTNTAALSAAVAANTPVTAPAPAPVADSQPHVTDTQPSTTP